MNRDRTRSITVPCILRPECQPLWNGKVQQAFHVWVPRMPAKAHRHLSVLHQLENIPVRIRARLPHGRSKSCWGRCTTTPACGSNRLACARPTANHASKIPNGTPDHIVPTVTENRRTLPFNTHGFEDASGNRSASSIFWGILAIGNTPWSPIPRSRDRHPLFLSPHRRRGMTCSPMI